jgi:hypothetical protein
MKNFTKAFLCSAAALALMAVWLPAQEKKSAPGKSKILQPQMTVETGSYEAPAGKLGDKPDQPWSATTIGASVDSKPIPVGWWSPGSGKSSISRAIS